MPQTLNVKGISVVAVKNQKILKASPSSQLANTDRRKPLHDFDCALARICGIGRVASTDRPTIPINGEYNE